MFMVLPQVPIPSCSLWSFKILLQFVCLFLRISIGLTSPWPRSRLEMVYTVGTQMSRSEKGREGGVGWGRNSEGPAAFLL